jgi:hypothetical protein
MSIATSEPTTITAGDTLQWTKALPDYAPADGWTLHYALDYGTTHIGITAGTSGTSHFVNVAAAITADYTPGSYVWTSYVTNTGGDRFTVERGSLTIFSNPASAASASHAERTLALIEAALEGRIPRGLEKTNIDGQELERIPIKDLEALQVRYQQKVAAEQARARIRAGLGNPRNSFARFTRP